MSDKLPPDLKRALQAGADREIAAALGRLQREQAAQLVQGLSEEDRVRVVRALAPKLQVKLVELLSSEMAADVLEELAPPMSADLLEHLDEEQRAEVFAAMELEDQAEVLREFDDEDALDEILESLPDALVADIAEQQLSDDATDLIEDLPEERRARVLEEMEAEKRAEIAKLVRYPEESAGGLMQTELVRLRPEFTVEDATEVVRRECEHLGQLLQMFIVDQDGRLLGSIRGRDLLLNPPGRVVGDFMRTSIKSVPVTMDQEKIADIVADYDLSSIPVVDENDRLLGRILIDDIVDVIEVEATEDVALMAGTEAEDVYSQSILLALRARFPWLLATFCGGLLTVMLILTWEEMLVSDIPLLAAAIPIIMGMSGNVGTQAATVTVRGIAVGEIDFAKIGSVVAKEMVAGTVFALCFGMLLYPIIYWGIGPVTGDADLPAKIVLVPTIAMTLTIAMASATGTLVPLILHKLGRDPAVASAPFITTTVDVFAIALLVGVRLLVL